jgi:hypothetical protein
MDEMNAHGAPPGACALKSMCEDVPAGAWSLRGQRVLLDSDLAVVYGVTTARLNQQVNRNLDRSPQISFLFHPIKNLKT